MGKTSDGINSLVPAELKLFFHFESDPELYSVVHSCHYRNEKAMVLSII